MAMPMSTACEGKKKRGATPIYCAALAFQPCVSRLSLVRDGQSFSAFAAAGGQHFSTVGGRHSLAETVLVCSFSQRRLECSFHFKLYFLFLFSSCFFLKTTLVFVKIEFAKVHNFFELLIKISSPKNFFAFKLLSVNKKAIKINSFFFCLKNYLYICKSNFQSKKLLIGA